MGIYINTTYMVYSKMKDERVEILKVFKTRFLDSDSLNIKNQYLFTLLQIMS